MSHLKDEALQEVEIARVNDVLEYDVYCLLFDALNEIEPLAERDKELEEMWEDLQNVAFDDANPNEDMKLLAPWGGFPAGTSREDIWHWFDERYSKGVAYLLYGDGVDRTRELAHLYYMSQLWFDCDGRDCVFNSNGTCRFAMVHGRKPVLTDEDGCKEYCFKGATK